MRERRIAHGSAPLPDVGLRLRGLLKAARALLSRRHAGSSARASARKERPANGSAPAAKGGERNVYASERFAGKFRRVIALPEDAEPSRVEATYRNGVLKVVVPKRESSKPRQIPVSSAS